MPIGMFERTKLFGFAGDAQIWRLDLFGVAFPGDRLAEFVELVLVDDAGHIHEALLERRRRFLKDRVAAGLVTHRHHRASFDARLISSQNSAEQRTEAGAGDGDLRRIELGPRRDPVGERRTGRHPVLHGEVQPDHRRFVLAGPVDRQHRHAAIEILVAVQRDLDFLVAVHAGHRDHHRQLAAGVARWQMQPRRDRLVLERHPDRFDVVVGERGILRVALALLVVVGDVGFVVLVVGPLRGAPMHRRHEEIVARGHLVIGLRRGVGLGFAALGHGGEGRADIGHLLHALADAGKIGIGLDAARQMDVERARLVPVDAVGADDIVDQPALRVETAHLRRRRDDRGSAGNPASGGSWHAP